MTKDLKQKLIRKAKGLGADLVSACSVEQMEKYPGAKEEIAKIYPKAKSFLVYGVRMVSSSIAGSDKNIRVPQYSTKLLYEELDRVGFGLMRELDDLGFSASPIPTYLPVPMLENTKGLIAELSLRHIAYEAGLGSIGNNFLLITKEFGPRIRFGAILTDAELKPGKPLANNFCIDCDLCIKKCPTGALKTKGAEAITLCASNAHCLAPAAVRAYRWPSLEPANTKPWPDRMGELRTGPPVANSHLREPSLFKA